MSTSSFFQPLSTRWISVEGQSLSIPLSRRRVSSIYGRVDLPRVFENVEYNRLLRLNLPSQRCYCYRNPVAVASEEAYGNKEVISLTPQIYDYVLSNVREPQVLKELREETARMRGSQMQVSPDQAQLLAMLVQMLGAERCIEVGVFTGYSSLAVALVLPETGCLVACERDGKSLEVAKKFYEKAGVSHKVDVRHGLAIDSLTSLLVNGEAGSYDFAFVDAEKKMNQEYFELLLQLIRVGGVIVVDNVIWHGRVVDPLVTDAKTVSIRKFNEFLFEDKRVNINMVSIGDGMTICRRVQLTNMNECSFRKTLEDDTGTLY